MFTFFSKSFSQTGNYQCGDTLLIKLTCFKGGKQKCQQLIKIFCKDNTATIKLYDKYKVTVVPKEGLDKEKLTIAEMLIKTKDTNQLSEQYKKYLSVPVNDSLSVLKLSESYETEQSFNQQKSTTIDCLGSSNKWLIKEAKENKTSNRKKRTKIEFRESGNTNIYFLDGYYDSGQVFKCLFN